MPRLVAFLLLFFIGLRPAWAGLTDRDLMVATRALTFLENPPKGTVDLGIVSDPADPASVKDAETAKAVIGQGLLIGDLTVRARLLTSAEVQNAGGLAAILVTGTSKTVFQEVATAARSRKLLTIATQPDCIGAGFCVMLVHSQPKIEVFANSRLARENGVSFGQTFSMMIKEYQ